MIFGRRKHNPDINQKGEGSLGFDIIYIPSRGLLTQKSIKLFTSAGKTRFGVQRNKIMHIKFGGMQTPAKTIRPHFAKRIDPNKMTGVSKTLNAMNLCAYFGFDRLNSDNK